MNSSSSSQWRIAIDIGGTFTDLELLHPASDRGLSHKTPTTPEDPAAGLIRGISEICQKAQIQPTDLASLMHGTTIATNAILQQRFPPAALITTAGFRDVLEIGRHVRTDVYSQIAETRPNPIPRRFRYGVDERTRANGEIEIPLNRDQLDQIVQKIQAQNINVVAVCLLHAYANPEHENEIAETLAQHLDHSYISVSSQISPEAREYERTATTVLNTLLMPVVRDYIEHLQAELAKLKWGFPIYLVQSNGGVTTPEIAAEQPVRLVLSGPSGGVRAAEVLSSQLQQPNLVAIDMGGTSFDVSIVRDHRAQQRTDGKVGDMPVRIPMLEMRTIGAGGGSIAEVDDGGRLTVGPDSAGAVPGPAAYALGGDAATVTDANVVLGRIDPHCFLGGTMVLDTAAAERAMQKNVAAPLALSVSDAAEGVIRIAVSHMAAAIRLSLFEKGLDPRDFVLMSFGGAAGLHATLVADELGSSQVTFPNHCGTLSAWGMLHADIAHDLSQTKVSLATLEALPGLRQTTTELINQGSRLLDRSGASAANRYHEISVDMRYPGQGWEIPVTLVDAQVTEHSIEKLCTEFHDHHQQQFAHSDPDITPEIVTIRNRAVGVLDRPPAQTGYDRSVASNSGYSRNIYWNGRQRQFDVIERDAVSSEKSHSRVVVEDVHSTIIIPDGWSASATKDGTIIASKTV